MTRNGIMTQPAYLRPDLTRFQPVSTGSKLFIKL